MKDIFNYTYAGNSIGKIVLLILIFSISIILVQLFKKYLLSQIKSWVINTNTEIDDLFIDGLERFGIPILRFLIFFWLFNLLKLTPEIEKWSSLIYKVVVIYFVVRFILYLLRKILEQQVRKQGQSEAKIKQVAGIMAVVNITVWAIALLVLFNNLGYNITAILTGLGIGGIAIALAAQNILGDLFNYFVIFFDRPFEIGDFIVVDDKKGTVEYIGIKTTRIRSISGEQLVISNSNLTSSRIHNFKRLESRRVIFNLGIKYGTNHQQLVKIPSIVKSIIENKLNARFDRAHFASFGDFSLNFEIVFYVDTSDYNAYMDVLEMVNLDIYEKFATENIEFAFPTQTLHVQRED